VLHEIWAIAAQTSSEYLTKEEFYVALRLIAYAQNGMRVEEDSVRFNLDVDLPRFESAPLALPPSEPSGPSAEDIAKHLPDLDSLDANQLAGIHSLIPSVNQQAQQKQM